MGYFLDEYLSPNPHTTFKGALADKIHAVLDVIFKNNNKNEVEEDVLSNRNSESRNDSRGSSGGDDNDAADKNDKDERSSNNRGPSGPNAMGHVSTCKERGKNAWPKRFGVQTKLSLLRRDEHEQRRAAATMPSRLLLFHRRRRRRR